MFRSYDGPGNLHRNIRPSSTCRWWWRGPRNRSRCWRSHSLTTGFAENDTFPTAVGLNFRGQRPISGKSWLNWTFGGARQMHKTDAANGFLPKITLNTPWRTCSMLKFAYQSLLSISHLAQFHPVLTARGVWVYPVSTVISSKMKLIQKHEKSFTLKPNKSYNKSKPNWSTHKLERTPLAKFTIK